MAKNKKQKSSLKWILLVITGVVLFTALTLSFDKLVDPIGRSLLKKSYPVIYKALPKQKLTWSLLDGIHLQSLRLANLDPSISVLQAKGVWLGINYWSLLADKVTINDLKIEGLYIKSRGNVQQAMTNWVENPGKFLGKELRQLLQDSDLKVLSIKIHNSQYPQRPIVEISKLKGSLNFLPEKTEIIGEIAEIRLHQLETRDVDFMLTMKDKESTLKINELLWGDSPITVTSKIKTKSKSIQHVSEISFEKLPISQSSHFLFDTKAPINTNLKGKFNAQGPLLNWKSWTANGTLEMSSFRLKDFGFQKSVLIQERAPIFSDIQFQSIQMPNVKLQNGEILWENLVANTDKFTLDSKGKINSRGRFFLRGEVKITEDVKNKLPTLTQKALSSKDGSYFVPLVMEGDFENQEILNIGSIISNAVGNQIKSIGRDLGGLFN